MKMRYHTMASGMWEGYKFPLTYPSALFTYFMDKKLFVILLRVHKKGMAQGFTFSVWTMAPFQEEGLGLSIWSCGRYSDFVKQLQARIA